VRYLRHFAAAICLSAVCTNIQSAPKPDAAKEPTHSQQEQQIPYAPLTLNAPIETPYRTPIHQERCPDSKNSSDAELCSQIRAADAAEKQVELSFLQVWVGGISTAALLVTIILTVRATNAASRAAMAAEQSANSYKFSERAWISHFATEVYKVRVQGNFVGFGLKIWWKNAGRTPAPNSNCFVKHEFVAKESKEIPRFKVTKATVSRSSPVGPDIGFSSNEVSITIAEVMEIATQKKSLLLYSRVDYTDIFHPRKARHSEICCEVLFENVIPDLLNPDAPTRIRTTNIGPQNTAT
jgi:hypothetical protein